MSGSCVLLALLKTMVVQSGQLPPTIFEEWLLPSIPAASQVAQARVLETELSDARTARRLVADMLDDTSIQIFGQMQNIAASEASEQRPY